MRKKMLLSVFLLSITLAVYGPMVTYSHAQSVSAAELQALKQKVSTEIDRRIMTYQKSLDTLGVDAGVSKDTSEASVDPMKNVVKLPSGLEDKVEQSLERMINQLKALKTKANEASTLSSVQSIAKNLDPQYALGKLTQVQAAVTQSVETMTDTLASLKSATTKLESQIVLIKKCQDAQQKGQSLSDVPGVGSGVSCNDFKLDSDELYEQAQLKLDGIETTVATNGSLVAASVSVLNGLVLQFDALTKSLGGPGGLKNIDNVGNLLSSTQLNKLTNDLAVVDNLLSAFSAVTSQLDISSVMAVNGSSELTLLSEAITNR